MPTMVLMLDEREREHKLPVIKGVHYASLHLNNFKFSDEEIDAAGRSLVMLLMGALQGGDI